MRTWITSARALLDFLVTVMFSAPEFPEEDYLQPEEQMTLERAFSELRAGLRFFPWLKAEGLLGEVNSLLAEAERAFEKAVKIDGHEVLAMYHLAALRREPSSHVV